MKRYAGTFFLAMLLINLTFASVAHAERTDQLGGTGGNPIDGSLQVRVVDALTGDPFEGAFVLVGSSEDEPFPNNWGLTSATGDISFTDPALQGPIMVTAGIDGYAFFTFVSVDADDLVIPLKPIVLTDPIYQVGDYVSGIDVNNGIFHAGDGYIDMAFVIPTLRLEDLMSFDITSLIGPPETINILGNDFEVPSNFFIPQQWELFIEINKDHYYVYLPAGDYTLSAMSGRIHRDVLLAGGDMTGLLPEMNWREIDILDVTVSGDMYTADLNVDPDLTETVTMHLDNVPEGTTAWCISAGDLDDRAGMGRLVPLGINSLDCPEGSPCAGTVPLTTTSAVGEFAGMTYMPAAAVTWPDMNDMVFVADRDPHPQTYTVTLSTFFSRLDLYHSYHLFSWNDVENTANGSPAVDVQTARIEGYQTEEPELYWEFMIPGGVFEFSTPQLPAQAPPGPVDGTDYVWEQMALGLTYDIASFDFNDFALTDIFAHGTHLASDARLVHLASELEAVGDDVVRPGLSLDGGRPNPFTNSTTIGFELPQTAEVDLSIYTVDGRKLTTLVSGEMKPGEHAAVWDGTSSDGKSLPRGRYMARLKVNQEIASRSIVVLR